MENGDAGVLFSAAGPWPRWWGVAFAPRGQAASGLSRQQAMWHLPWKPSARARISAASAPPAKPAHTARARVAAILRPKRPRNIALILLLMASLFGQGGIAVNLRDSDNTSIFADFGIDKALGRGFEGGGAGVWDVSDVPERRAARGPLRREDGVLGPGHSRGKRGATSAFPAVHRRNGSIGSVRERLLSAVGFSWPGERVR